MSDPGTFNDGWSNLSRVGGWLAGPFHVGVVSQPAGVLIETPNPDWWGNTPKLSQLTFRVVGPDDRFTALQHGRLDAYAVANYGAFGNQSTNWADIGFMNAT